LSAPGREGVVKGRTEKKKKSRNAMEGGGRDDAGERGGNPTTCALLPPKGSGSKQWGKRAQPLSQKKSEGGTSRNLGERERGYAKMPVQPVRKGRSARTSPSQAERKKKGSDLRKNLLEKEGVVRKREGKTPSWPFLQAVNCVVRKGGSFPPEQKPSRKRCNPEKSGGVR